MPNKSELDVKHQLREEDFMTKKETLKWTLQIIASVISAILTALGTTSCMGV